MTKSLNDEGARRTPRAVQRGDRGEGSPRAVSLNRPGAWTRTGGEAAAMVASPVMMRIDGEDV